MKKKVLLTSIATIALCLCLIAGSTFALFTDKTEFNIAVTSGDVEVYAYASIVDIWSAEGAEKLEDEYLVDEKGNIYNHANRTKEGSFINGGVAELTGDNNQNLTISKITPGDRVDLNINVTNSSDIAISYRYKISIDEDNGLASGMVLNTPDGKDYEGFESYISAWKVIAPNEKIDPVMISVELPVYAGDEYQSEHKGGHDDDGVQYTEDIIKDVTYTILVEAVQGNAVTENESIVTILPETIQKKILNGGIVDGNNATLNLTENLTVMNRDVTVTNTVIDGTNADAGDATVPFLVAGGDLTLGEGAVVTAGDYGVFVMEGDKLTLDTGSKLIVPDGTIAAINGQVACNTFDLYINDTGLIVDEEGNVADTRIALLCGGTFRIHVPTAEVYDEYVDMIDADTTAQTIEWYIDERPVTTHEDPIVGDSEGDTYEGELFEDLSDALIFQSAELTDDATITIKRTYKTVALENVVANVKGDLITAEADNTIILHNCDITLSEGAKLITTTNGAIVGQVMMHNVTVNGELLTQTTAAQYMQGVNWYQVW